MNDKAPSAWLSTPPDPVDVEATLVALQLACNDDALPEATRELLQRAADALRTSSLDAESAHRRYHALFDAVPDPVSIIDWDGTVLDLNKAGMAAYKRSREEIVGRPIHVLNPDLPRDHLNPVWESLDRGDTYVIEVTNMRSDGSRFPVEVHSAGFAHEGRKCIVAVARDLSGRRTAELRYRELIESIDKGIVVQDAQGHVVHANVAAMRMLGVGEGQQLSDALRPDRWLVLDEFGRELPPDRLPHQLALNTGKITGSTVLGLYHRDRRELSWLSVTSVPQFPAGGDHPEQVLSLFSDVTELKRDSNLFDRAQALAHIGGWDWDAGRERLYLTDEAQRILGRVPALETLEDMLACLNEPHRSRLRHAVELTMAGGRHLDLELQGTHPDGRVFWVRVIGEVEGGESLKSRLTGTLQDITERKRAEESLRVQARTDPLTGLLNRDAALSEMVSRLDDPERAALAVLYIDLDRFKVVNDVLGHAAGDRLLCSAARRIQRAVGAEASIARFGGDEFLVICDTSDDATRPERLADAILETFGDSFRMDGEEFSITASIGIAQAPFDGVRSQQLIQSADVAMYDSKRRGRNGWQAFTPELAEQQLQRLQLETHLRRAVHNDEFHLVYQPQVDLGSGALVAVEALIRWRNQSLGEMRPDRFIDHAESTGDIVGIGGWVLQEACLQMQRWRQEGLDIPRVAVNVSYRQFLGEDLASCVAAALADAGLPGSALELEFTERVLIEDAPDTLRTFAALRALGVTLTIDDFGEGYSALNYLRRLPIHGLKLSQLFVQGVPDNQSDVAVCQAVTGIARSLGLSLIAEGVETEEQRRFLLQLEVPVGQGFLFAAGLKPDDLASYCARVGVLRAEQQAFPFHREGGSTSTPAA
ncbi:sensor domain-containing protein [Montanilutibacter psychrotolerans]|uniref:EAL domain-containing protein n=1 Tax=Montanilutibacter psychrotolerans TaxID=1327343 RepID=A0A3M8SYM2_9GAMM|nr:EAL domain-containing protein [Lysobacter psychrotolerans]RNF86457.1 EAL domain-containing protein [Lysobacter psychrotolerans]